MTFERALQIRRLARRVPDDAPVLETDAPDIPPHWLYLHGRASAQRGAPIAQRAGRAAAHRRRRWPSCAAGRWTRRRAARAPTRCARAAAPGALLHGALRVSHDDADAPWPPLHGLARRSPRRTRAARARQLPRRGLAAGAAVLRAIRATTSGRSCRRCGASTCVALAYAAAPGRSCARAASASGTSTRTCRREGSLDSAIEDARARTTWPALAARCRGWRAIAHNGGESARAMRITRALGLPVHRLPSTSPANASWSFERKLAAWRAVFERQLASHDARRRRRRPAAPRHHRPSTTACATCTWDTPWVQGAMRVRKPRAHRARVRAAHDGLDAVARRAPSSARGHAVQLGLGAGADHALLPSACCACARHRGRAQPGGHRRLPPVVPPAGRRRAADACCERDAAAWVADAGARAARRRCCASTSTTTRPPRRCSTATPSTRDCRARAGRRRRDERQPVRPRRRASSAAPRASPRPSARDQVLEPAPDARGQHRRRRRRAASRCPTATTLLARGRQHRAPLRPAGAQVAAHDPPAAIDAVTTQHRHERRQARLPADRLPAGRLDWRALLQWLHDDGLIGADDAERVRSRFGAGDSEPAPAGAPGQRQPGDARNGTAAARRRGADRMAGRPLRRCRTCASTR